MLTDGRIVAQEQLYGNTYGTLVTTAGVFEVRGRSCADPAQWSASMMAQNAELDIALKAAAEGKPLFLSAAFWLKPIAAPSKQEGK